MKVKKIKYVFFAGLIALYYFLPIVFEKILSYEYGYAHRNVIYTRYIIVVTALLLVNGILIWLLSLADPTWSGNAKIMRFIKICIAVIFIGLHVTRQFIEAVAIVIPFGGNSDIMWLTLSGYLLASSFKRYRK